MARALLLALAAMASGQEALQAESPATAASAEAPRELDDVTWTSASLLIAFVVFSGFLACLLHWNNKDIRKEAWALNPQPVIIGGNRTLNSPKALRLEP